MAFYRLLEESGCSLADRDHQYQTPRDVAMQAGLMENVAAIDKWVVNLVVTGECWVCLVCCGIMSLCLSVFKCLFKSFSMFVFVYVCVLVCVCV